MAGSVGGVVNGDVISQMALGSATGAIDYNFCELIPSSISGRVFADPEADCVFGPLDRPLAGVRVDLLDANGQQVGSTLTDAQGKYKFENLAPGAYSVREQQPAGYYQGGTMAGSVGGAVTGDVISQIALVSATGAIDYNFCELIPGNISGRIHADTDGDCILDPDELPLAGVTVQLLNDHGIVVGTAVTDTQGQYRFEGLAPGVYSVRELQPPNYFDGDEHVGTAGGVIVANDSSARLSSARAPTAANTTSAKYRSPRFRAMYFRTAQPSWCRRDNRSIPIRFATAAAIQATCRLPE